MRCIIYWATFVTCLAAPQYPSVNQLKPDKPKFTVYSAQQTGFQAEEVHQFPPVVSQQSELQSLQDTPLPLNNEYNVEETFCAEGTLPNAFGACSTPEVFRDIFVFNEPKKIKKSFGNNLKSVPNPKVKLNLVVIRTDEENDDSDEKIIVPPPKEKTVVLVLEKDDGKDSQEIIEVAPGPQQKPEVFFIKYQDGDNPILPGGIDLQTALAESGSDGFSIGRGAGVGGPVLDGGVRGASLTAGVGSPTYGSGLEDLSLNAGVVGDQSLGVGEFGNSGAVKGAELAQSYIPPQF